MLDEAGGLTGDNSLSRATSRAIAEGRHLDAMITVMSARMIGLLADDEATRALAGDQLYVDLDLSHDNLPAASRLADRRRGRAGGDRQAARRVQEVPGAVRRGRPRLRQR